MFSYAKFKNRQYRTTRLEVRILAAFGEEKVMEVERGRRRVPRVSAMFQILICFAAVELDIYFFTLFHVCVILQ